MNRPTVSRSRATNRWFALLAAILVFLGGWHFYLYGQNKSDFPEGYDAVRAAPDTHKVIFENSFVRVLEVTVPEKGGKVPMHHHRWPSFFLSWDTGGATAHIRYHRPGRKRAGYAEQRLPRACGKLGREMDESRAHA